MPVSWSSCWMV